MALGDRLSSLVKKIAGTGAPPSPWQPVGQPYPLLISFDPTALVGKAGLIAVWHLGVRPQWLKVAAVNDLALAVSDAKTIPEIVSYRPNGEVYMAWAMMPAPAAAARHLITSLAPILRIKLEGEIDVTKTEAVSCPPPPGTGD